MENRFGFKDFVVVVLLLVLIGMVGLAMVQYDRQWKVMDDLRRESARQTNELSQIARSLREGSYSSRRGPTTTRIVMVPSSQPSDPFGRVRLAQAMPGFAPGDRFIDGIPNIEKITPLISGDVYAADVQSRVLESLARRDPVTLKFMPLVAESWTISSDGLTIRFKLRNYVTFSDGQKLTADDVVFTFQTIMNPKVEAPRLRAYYQKMQSVEKAGEYEVVFTFKEPYFKSFDFAGGMPILPKHFYGRFPPEELNKKPGLLLGSGPYRMQDPESWAPGKQLVLVRNERYWGEPANIDRLIFKEFANDTAKLTDYVNGDLDGLFNLFPEQFTKLIEDKKLMDRSQRFEYDTPIAGYRYLGWNERRDGKPTFFADKRVRQAMTMLIDRKRLCDELSLGYATQIAGPFHPASKQCDTSIQPLPYDLAKAKALLKEAGFADKDGDGVLKSPDGKPFKFTLTYPSGNAAYQSMCFFIKDCLQRAGVIVEPQTLDWSVFRQKLKTRDFDAITLGWGSSIEGDIYQMFHSDQIKDGGDNNVSYSNPELDKLIEKARSTVDEDARMQLWHQCHRLLHEDQPYTFLLTRKNLVLLDKRFQNVQKLPLGLNDLMEWFVPAPDQKPAN